MNTSVNGAEPAGRVERERKPWWFKPGHQLGKGRSRRGEGKGRVKPPILLRRMRELLKCDRKVYDGPPQLRSLWELLHTKPGTFLARMTALEIAFMRIRERWHRRQERAQEQKKVRRTRAGFPMPKSTYTSSSTRSP
jgi:hypothetical protein